MTTAYTSGEYADRNPSWHAEDAVHKAAAVASLVLAAGVRPKTVLDVGCGTGDVLVALRRALDAAGIVATYVGVDVAPEALRRAAPKADDRLRFGPDDGTEKADLALLLDVVEHVPDDVALLADVARRARFVVVRLPLERSRWDDVFPRRWKEARERYGHLRRYERRDGMRLLDAAGLRLEAEAYDRVPPVLTKRTSQAIDGVRRGMQLVLPHAGVRWLGGFSWLALARSGGA